MGEFAKRRVLIVDDEEDIRAGLEMYFTARHWAVDTSRDVPEALERLAQGYDVVISDIMMPGATGIDLLHEIHARYPKTGVLLITGYPGLNTLRAAKQHGAVAYLRKPFQLTELEAEIRAFLGEDARHLFDGRVLVVDRALMERLGARLTRFQTVVCEGEEAAFLRALAEHRPVAILAEAMAPSTPSLLEGYHRQGREASSFLLVSQETGFDVTNKLLFRYGAADCIPMDTAQEELERWIMDAVNRRQGEILVEEEPLGDASSRCPFAMPYRRGYYCLKQGSCPDGPFREGWIAIEGKEYQKCSKRPLVVDSLEEIGIASWSGPVGQARDPLRAELLGLARKRKRNIVIDAQGLEGPPYNVFELLSDLSAELTRMLPQGVIHIINLPEAILREFRKATSNPRVRYHGPRMVDEKGTFERWGSRFD